MLNEVQIARFWSRVDKGGPEDCWPWTGGLHHHGYGCMGVPGTTMAHRIAYMLLRGSIPGGLVLDHLCRNILCCNPAHLEPVTILENLKRGNYPTKKTHCVNGHPFTEENTYQAGRLDLGRSNRQCRRCRADRERQRRLRRKQAASLDGASA